MDRMAAMEALKHQRDAVARMWQELADLIVNPPWPTAIEEQRRREETLRCWARNGTMIGQPAPTPSGSLS